MVPHPAGFGVAGVPVRPAWGRREIPNKREISLSSSQAGFGGFMGEMAEFVCCDQLMGNGSGCQCEHVG